MKKELEVYFLWWVIYASTVALAFILSLFGGLISLFLAADPTYLSIVIFLSLLLSFTFTGLSFFYSSYSRRITAFNDFASQLCMGLGMMGSLIGFALLLSGFNLVNFENAQSTNELVKQIGVGASTAIYTTIAGLGSAILIYINQYMIEKFMYMKIRIK